MSTRDETSGPHTPGTDTAPEASALHVFEHRTLLRHPREVVWRWLTNRGALTRLTPDYAGTVLQEPEPGLPVGAEAVLRISAPGGLGLFAGAAHGTVSQALSALLPTRLPAPQATWRARHTALEPGIMFRDEMVSGPLRSWVHTHTLSDAAPGEADTADGHPGTLVHDRIEYRLPADETLAKVPAVGKRTGRAAHDAFERALATQFSSRAALMAEDLDFHAAHPGPLHGAPAKTVVVTGASGLIGTRLCALLTSGGHTVVRLVRDESQAAAADASLWDPLQGRVDRGVLASADAVVNLAGASIAGRMTASHKEAVHHSRIAGTRTLAEAILGLASSSKHHGNNDDGRPAPALINGSAVGWYGADAGDGGLPEGLTEDLPAGEDFLAEVCRDWEAEARAVESAGIRCVRIRTGIALSPAGGMLQQLLPIFLAGLGGTLSTRGSGPDGTPWMSWISADDVASLFAHAALDGSVSGPLNAVAPEPVTAKEFAAALGAVLHRPSAVPVPGFGPRLLLGREGAELIVDADQKASSAAAEAAGHRFRHRTLDQALRSVLGR